MRISDWSSDVCSSDLASAAIARRIRIVGAACALPVAAACLLAPRQLEAAFGHELDLRVPLIFVTVAILCQCLTGPSQASLIMGAREDSVAKAYVTSYCSEERRVGKGLVSTCRSS